MNHFQKALLSIPSVVTWLEATTYFYPEKYFEFVGGFDNADIISHIIMGLILCSLGMLMYRIWKFEHVERKEKWKWTFLFVLFTTFSMFIYIWFFDDELEMANRESDTE